MLLVAMIVSHLAQAAEAASVVGWLLVVIVLVVGGFAAISWLRKWMREDDLPAGGMGFGLGELRQMHARGELSDAEYERARSKMTASAKAVTAAMPDPAGGRRAPGAGGAARGGAGATNPKRPGP